MVTMNAQDAIRHFGSVSNLASALGISAAAIYQWGDVVPHFSARRIEDATGGALRVDMSLYDERGRPLKPSAT